MTASNPKAKSNHGGGGNGGGFQSLNLSPPIFAGIKRLGYRTPTPVQRKSLPILLTASDACVMARTGSGKTVAFLAPLLERLVAARGEGGNVAPGAQSKSAFAVVLSPTRELSLQTLKVLRSLGHHCIQNYGFNFVGINGGESMEKQFALLSSRPDVIVATPGRLAHHLSEIPDFHLRQCECVVFDEADRLFEMGFAMQLRQICSSMPEHRQTMLFSATMPRALMEFTKTGMMHDPTVVRLDSEVAVSEELRIGFVTCRSAEKDAVLLHLVRDVLPLMKGVDATGGIAEEEPETADEEEEDSKKRKMKKKKEKKRVGKHSKRGLTLIFAATRHHVEYLTLLLTTSGLLATQIYGNMDNVARQHNLKSFMSGDCPILVVTDVAARGIDIPLIDHVIHYAFPPSAKLFVHRSGRAARAGRIGYCWGIVDPEELPYMVDLHVFLGRRMSTGRAPKSETNGHFDSEETEKEEKTKHDEEFLGDANAVDEELIYTLDEMTPEMVHYGSVPESVLVEEVENVRRMVDSELAGSHDAEMLKMLTKVCNNAMKQYRRSRPEASRQGVRRAKALLEGEKETGTGRRVLNAHGGIPSHPLLRFIEMAKLKATLGQPSNDTGGEVSTIQIQQQEEMAKKKMSDLQKRQDFLRAMANFRPKETVFEAFATGGQKDVIYSSQVDKCANGSAAAMVAMKSMRRQMKIARDKGGALVIAGSKSAQTLNGEIDEEYLEEAEESEQHGNVEDNNERAGESNITMDKEAIAGVMPPTKPPSINAEGKRRLSKAERKKMKKDPNYKPGSSSDAISKKAKSKRGADFRDDLHFIDNDATRDTAAAARSRQIEAAMQPSASSSSKGSSALAHRIEENMLDIVGDENVDLVKRQRMMRWDKSKRKYVQTTVGDELSGDSKSKKMRLESGQLVKSDKVKLGELYEKWQKKTNRSIGRVGVFDDVTEEVSTENTAAALQKGQKCGGRGKKSDGRNADDERKSAVAIRKERQKKEKNALKNMKKDDRRQLERKQRSERATEAQGGQGKKTQKGKKGGPDGRWKGSHKKGGKR
mmetsp:Transcript_42362/g.90123  ORF Transcript_42362/g.90123 Transcript_42362/m.90123 type:complete len:1047 (+) Transcript_42362:134-3274(+)